MISRVSGGAVVHIDGSNNSLVSFGGGVGQFGTSDFTVALWLNRWLHYALDMKDIPNFEWAKELVINPINGSPTQQWEINADGTIKNKSNGFAIALYDTGSYQVSLVSYSRDPAQAYEKWQHHL